MPQTEIIHNGYGSKINELSPDKKTVLIADDDTLNRKILVKILSEEYYLLESENGQQAFDMLQRTDIEVCAVILDLVMPVMDGYDFLNAIRGIEKFENLPVIVATGSTEAKTETDALKLGAWDFITKPYNGEIIKFRLRGAIQRSQLSAFNQLKYLAEYDTLTGIYNKSKFFAMTRDMLDRFPDKKFAFIRLDIDRFQLINSFFGMDEGDRLLCYLANSLKDNNDNGLYTYGRIEADVFAICCDYENRENVISSLERAKKYVKAYNESFDIVPVFGVYFLDDLKLSISEMLDRSALSAKACKGNYVNTIGIYDPQMSRKLTQEQEIINEMVAALEKKQFTVYFQPKYDLKTNLPAGAEALVRWQHPQKGLIGSDVFIPIFEKNGFIAKLDYYVWERVCSLLQNWISQGLDPAPISVNVSRANLYNPNTAKMIDSLVHSYSVPPHLFQIELTESAYTDNPQMMEQFINELHEKGYTILMDDFGNGYSSLSVLKNLPVDVLKIDMRFFSDTKISGRGENIIASVIRMAKWIRIPTVAEGVEKEDQVNFLRSVGCDYVQGYYFARPMTVDSYKKLITDNAPVAEIERDSGIVFNVDRLWSSNQEIEILFINAVQAACIYEFDGENIEVLRVNKSYTKLFGFRPRMQAAFPAEYMLKSDLDGVIDTFAKCADDKEPAVCVYRKKESSGKIMWVRMDLQYICPVGSKHIVIGNLADVTAVKAMEFTIDKLQSKQELNTLSAGLDERLFEINQVYSYQNMRVLMIFLTPIFDVIRLVDPTQTAVVTLDENGVLNAEPYRCFRVWGKDTRCENCTSICGIRENCKMTKYEFIQNNVFYVVSNPIKVLDGSGVQHDLVLEIVSRVSDHVMLGRSGGKTVGQLIEETQRKIYTDELTGVYNRRYFREMLFAHHGQIGVVEQLALVMLDLNSFKSINDEHGHAIGDDVLVKTAKALTYSVQQSDSVIRYGGDEFIVVLTNRNEGEVKKAIEHMRSSISDVRYGENEAWTAAADFGYAYTEKFDFNKDSIARMLREADKSMYKNKNARKSKDPINL